MIDTIYSKKVCKVVFYNSGRCCRYRSYAYNKLFHQCNSCMVNKCKLLYHNLTLWAFSDIIIL